MEKKCSKCGLVKDLDKFSYKFKAKDIRQRQCKDCVRFLIKNHYNNNRQYYLDKASKRNAIFNLEVVEYLKNYLLEHPCLDCGEKDVVVLEFDHRGDTPKIKAVSSLIRLKYPIEKIKLEIDKCDVRCANCHRRKTAKQFNWLKSNKRL